MTGNTIQRVSDSTQSKIDAFLAKISEIALSLKELDKKQIVRIITHLDADGICAASIMIKALTREGYKFSLSIVPQLNEETLKTLAKEDYFYNIFLDLGSGQITLIKKYLEKRKIFVIDHHHIENEENSIYHVNPHHFNIDGGTSISGAGVSYLVAKALDGKNKDSAFLALIGAIGDAQENNGFSDLNEIILKDAIASKKLIIKKGLKLFGSQTRPLHKTLELSNDMRIPGVTNSESGSIQFLHDLGINPKLNGRWKTLAQLSPKEERTLITGIILKRENEKNPEDVFGETYLLANEAKDSLFYNAKEFSTLLNACGRLDKPSIGIGICLGSKKAKKKAQTLLKNYKIELMESLDLIYKNKLGEDIIKGDKLLLINAKHAIRTSIIGTVSSILSKSPDFKEYEYIIIMGRDDQQQSKISFRTSQRKEDINLRTIMKEILKGIGGEFGGHKHAAGAIVPVDKEEEFIQAAQEHLKKIVKK